MRSFTHFLLSLGTVVGAQRLEAGISNLTLQACEDFGNSLSLENVTINVVEYLPKGTNLTISQDYELSTCGYRFVIIERDLCRIAMNVKTSGRSETTVETWLPSNWTGRFLSTGNGGVGGCLQYPDMTYTSGLGFATVGTNNGHNGTRGIAFGNNTEILHDFVERSMHTGVVLGKQITKQYYGTAHRKSYYLGCSTGGRQGFKAVQTYPEDFDGVIAGAPALQMAALNSWSARFYTIFGTVADPTFIPAGALWTAIHQEILNQCDSIDGAVDGILEDPSLCQFRPEALQCRPGNANTTSCLTKAQVGAVKEAFSDFNGADGQLIYPRMQPGSEAIASRLYYTPGPFPYSTDWFRYVVYNNSTWDPALFTNVDAKVAINQNPFNVQTWEGDLSAFKAKGGKVLHWHGQMDAVISSEQSPRYYEHVSKTMRLKPKQMDEFYRFFEISGSGHCSGGDGAHSIGQNGQEVSNLDPQNNVLLRIVEWVEKGKAPETLTGTKFNNDNPTHGVDFVRRHCKYPRRNVCVDPNNYKSPAAWQCK